MNPAACGGTVKRTEKKEGTEERSEEETTQESWSRVLAESRLVVLLLMMCSQEEGKRMNENKKRAPLNRQAFRPTPKKLKKDIRVWKGFRGRKEKVKQTNKRKGEGK